MRQAYLICINALNDYVFYHVYTLFFSSYTPTEVWSKRNT